MKRILIFLCILLLSIESLAMPIVVIGRNNSIYEYNSTVADISKNFAIGNNTMVATTFFGLNSYLYYGIILALLFFVMISVIVFFIGYNVIHKYSNINPYFN